MIRAKSEGSTTPKHHLSYMSIHSPLLTRGFEHSIGPHIQLVGDTFIDFEFCKSTDEVDPKTGIITRTKTLLNGGKAIETIDTRGTISEDVYDKDGSLISSSVASITKYDPKSINTAVSIHKSGKKDITIEPAGGGAPITSFTMTKSGKIAPSSGAKVDQIFDNKYPGNHLASSNFVDSNGVAVDVLNGDKRATGWKSIKVEKSGSPITEVIMKPNGALLRPTTN